jgi:hypothetical protein
MTIELTRFRKFNGSLTKVLSLLPTGEVRKDSAGCAMSSGEFETLSISHVRAWWAFSPISRKPNAWAMARAACARRAKS